MDFLPNCKTENTKKTVLLDFSRWMFFQEAKKNTLKKTLLLDFVLMYFCFKVTQTKPPKNSYFFINFCFQVAGNIGLINPLIFNHFGYGTYAQVAYKLLLLIPKSLFHFFFSVVVNQYFSDHMHVLPHLPRVAVGRFQN